jgi:hypothetical protein
MRLFFTLLATGLFPLTVNPFANHGHQLRGLLRPESDFATDKPRAEVNPTYKTASLATRCSAMHKSNTG